MARKKRSVALFEVIHKDKRFDRPGALAAPSIAPSWLGSRAGRKAAIPLASPESDPGPVSAAAASPSTSYASATLMLPPPKRTPTPVEPPTVDAPATARQQTPPEPSMRQSSTERAKDFFPPRPARVGLITEPEEVFTPPVEKRRIDWRALGAAKWKAARAWIQGSGARGIDWARQQASVAAGVLVAGVVIGGVCLARHANRPPAAPIAQTIEQVRNTTHPQVLNVRGSKDSTLLEDERAAERADEIGAARAEPASAVQIAPTRQVNLNYALIASYPDVAYAQKAAAFLNSRGVACTVEQGFKPWRRDFYLVIGLRGFAHTSYSDYADYRSYIEQVGVGFQQPRGYRRGFQPRAMKWPGPQPAARG